MRRQNPVAGFSYEKSAAEEQCWGRLLSVHEGARFGDFCQGFFELALQPQCLGRPHGLLASFLTDI